MDPFAGSGTTLVLAKKLGMRGVGIDIKREYCDIATSACKRTQANVIPLKSIPLVTPHLTGAEKR
jgi:DNA modification methylase